MSWTFEQSTGKLSLNGKHVATGYSGRGAGKNNPSLESSPNVGPIPRGVWSIGTAFKHSAKGPICMRLTPERTVLTFGRSGFLIHGDSKKHPGLASEGCIILPRSVRELISTHPDRTLEVVAGPQRPATPGAPSR